MEIFRKQSLEKIRSSDNRNDYVRTPAPSIWLLVIAAAALLIGAFLWFSFGWSDIADSPADTAAAVQMEATRL